MIRFFILACISLALSWSECWAQRVNASMQARHYLANSQTDSAILYFQMAYDEAPFDVKLYNEFLSVLFDNKKLSQAETLITRMMSLRPEDPQMKLDQAHWLKLSGKDKEYKKTIESLIELQYSKNSYHVQNLANAFVSRQMIDEAVSLYEKSSRHHGNTQIFGKELMNLYLEQGHIDRVIPYFAEFLPFYPNLNEDIKSKILKLIEKDSKNKEKIEKALKTEIKKKNDYTNEYISLLNWLNQLDGRHEEALKQLIDINKKNPEAALQDIITLGQEAMLTHNYHLAEQAFTHLVQNTQGHTKELGYNFLLRNNYLHLYHQRPYDEQLVVKTMDLFKAYFYEYPLKKRSFEYLWYADVKAKFAKQPQEAIKLVAELIDEPNLPKQILGQAKLLLGDFYLFSGQVWDANLSYAQVDKLFRQDKLGEEARYKQAKLSFYRGDFKWAQNQLNVLKASTTELISNDAMQLSILITENSFNDSITEPLKMYARADLLMYQQQFLDATQELKKILEMYPEHDLTDDVYLLLGNIAVESGQYADAVTYYKKIVVDYYDDVIADDALLKLAQVYNSRLNDKVQAKIYYEQLITDFSNSSLVPIARSEYNNLKSDTKL